MLYIYVIQNRAYPAHVYSAYFTAATRCQSHLSAIAEKGSLSERYCLVLEELRVEATRQTTTTANTAVATAAAAASSQFQPADNTNANRYQAPVPVLSLQQRQEQELGHDGSPPDTNTIGTSTGTGYTDSPDDVGSSGNGGIEFGADVDDVNVMAGLGLSVSDCSGWGQFTSMVSCGLGNMDLFWGNEMSF